MNNIDEPFILDHSDGLTHFHIHDAIGSKDHLTLGSGEIILKERLKIAEKYGCRCVIETKTLEALKESVRWISILKEANKLGVTDWSHVRMFNTKF